MEAVTTAERWQLTNRELVELASRKEMAFRREYSEILELWAELDSRGAAYDLGYSNSAALMMHTLRVSRSEANHRLRHAASLNDTTTPTGSVVEATMPLTAGALERGEVGAETVEVIQKFLKSVDHIEPEQRALAEKLLVDQAAQDDPIALTRYAENTVRDLVDPDGKLPSDEERRRPERDLRLHERKDGSVEFKGRLDPENGQLLKGLLAPGEKREPDDDRSPSERSGDAFADVIRMAANCPELPTHNGLKNDVAFTISFDWLSKVADDAVIPGLETMTAGDMRRIACDCRALPAVMDGPSKPLDIAVPAYVVPAHMRRGLVLRDRGCAFPGCARPASACDSHHIRSWITQGGLTEMDNLVLLCPHHHRLIHRSEWEVRLDDGVAWFTPPDYVDPARRPRRNALHRPAPS